jgi:hypothetical protein
MAKYDAAEQMLIEKGSDVRGKHFDVWQPESGIINIFENIHYEDPGGLLPLNVRQMKSLKEWARPIDTIPANQFVNGKPDIATNINGYEVM